MRTLGWVLLFALVFPLSVRAEGVQATIDKTPAYGVVKLASGVYDESLRLAKPLTLEGVGKVTIRSCRSPVVTISSHHVVLRNVTIEQCGNASDRAALYVTGHDHTMERVHIFATERGIQLDKARRTTIVHCVIQGKKNGNGIDLWESSQNNIQDTTIRHVKDGIYMENSHENILSENNIRDARYGIHVMFSNGIVLRKNVSEKNIAGAMVMGTKRTTIEQNLFRENNRNVHSQGLLLYDATETVVRGNEIVANRVGMYVENARYNELLENDIRRNFIGMQWNASTKNRVADNSFVGNVHDAQAIHSTNNTIIHNYWDAALKLDVTGKGFSAIPYRADPFFLALTTNVPEYQLFFQAPSMIVLQKLLRSPDKEVLIDQAPRMKEFVLEKKHAQPTSPLYMMSVAMAVGSISLLMLGRKR
ncbi:nitrous oxidase accessory protein [Anoxybacillus voinovskiensis]|uniref:Nitrous oxidase accessory protein n=1 Tax=Anoxybacteroides voinovskiense TaxID=230470 RepID=A0A840DYA0_9BACL|nr:NosD domain-containing protein [Anoxybacillus voinovskiensis]MBB4074499.1 nitrous oxidase accessory protein [Anoxybacillus voinovskiensis]GGJ71604.1 hypothetical protein GCM10008982_21180 [Anoxybacillus voinovskiensis]